MCLAVPGKIISIAVGGSPLMAKADFGGVRKEICLALTPEAANDLIGRGYKMILCGFDQLLLQRAAAGMLDNIRR